MANSLFSNHGHVLLFLANDPDARLRDVAAAVGVTERAVQKIVRDLQDENLLSVSKRGRRNRYRINTRKALRHPLETHRTVGQLISLMKNGPARPGAGERAPQPAPRPMKPAPSPRSKTGATAVEAAARESIPVTEEAVPEIDTDDLDPPVTEAGDAIPPSPSEKDESGKDKKPSRESSRKGRKSSRDTSPSSDDEQQGSLF